MGLLDKLFTKKDAKISQQHNPQLAAQCERHVERAVEIADGGVTVVFSGGMRLRSGSGETFMNIQAELETAVKLCPDVPAYRYLLADAKINAGLRQDGREEIIKLAEEFPDFIEAQGFSQAVSRHLNWFSPFDYHFAPSSLAATTQLGR
jgi:hypothetical protein